MEPSVRLFIELVSHTSVKRLGPFGELTIGAGFVRHDAEVVALLKRDGYWRTGAHGGFTEVIVRPADSRGLVSMRFLDHDEIRKAGRFGSVSISDIAVTTDVDGDPVAFLEREDQAWRVLPDAVAFAEIELAPILVK
jgi:hypothetical protein